MGRVLLILGGKTQDGNLRAQNEMEFLAELSSEV